MMSLRWDLMQRFALLFECQNIATMRNFDVCCDAMMMN